MAACKVCEEPLFMSVEDEEAVTQNVPDDLSLPCSCHFHWYVKTRPAKPRMNCESSPAHKTDLSSNSARKPKLPPPRKKDPKLTRSSPPPPL